MKVSELLTQLKDERSDLEKTVTEQRELRDMATANIRTATEEMVRIDRLIRAAEGRTRKDAQGGGSQ